MTVIPFHVNKGNNAIQLSAAVIHDTYVNVSPDNNAFFKLDLTICYPYRT